MIWTAGQLESSYTYAQFSWCGAVFELCCSQHDKGWWQHTPSQQSTSTGSNCRLYMQLRRQTKQCRFGRFCTTMSLSKLCRDGRTCWYRKFMVNLQHTEGTRGLSHGSHVCMAARAATSGSVPRHKHCIASDYSLLDAHSHCLPRCLNV